MAKLSDDQMMMLKKVNAQTEHLEFMKYCWAKSAAEPFIPGFHTTKICKRIDKAFDDFRKGKSSYILISVHPRAGKTDIVSRYLGPHFLGEFPNQEVMQVTYQSQLASTFSTFGRNVFRSKKFNELYPNARLSDETNQKANWVLVDSEGRPTGGKLYASGLQSGLTGNGFALGILDDYFKGRAEAESKIQRDNAWESFVNDFMTRAAPVAIVIVLATQWHIDDINGRIKKEMQINPDFPQFDVLSFPAKSSDYVGDGTYPNKYLFMERYPEQWYRTQYATLGTYSSSALFDCNPTPREGGRFSLDGIVYYDDHPQKNWVRIWDLAHTAKQRAGDDPDWTSGTKLCFERVPGDPVPHLWVDHVFRTRDDAAERDAKIRSIVKSDSVFVRQALEVSMDAKDAYDYLTRAVPETSWNKISLAGKGDKGARATPLEAIFACPGHVHVRRADWNNDWIDEIIRFDGLGKNHDDQVDNLSSGYIFQIAGSTISMSDATRQSLANRRK